MSSNVTRYSLLFLGFLSNCLQIDDPSSLSSSSSPSLGLLSVSRDIILDICSHLSSSPRDLLSLSCSCRTLRNILSSSTISGLSASFQVTEKPSGLIINALRLYHLLRTLRHETLLLNCSGLFRSTETSNFFDAMELVAEATEMDDRLIQGLQSIRHFGTSTSFHLPGLFLVVVLLYLFLFWFDDETDMI